MSSRLTRRNLLLRLSAVAVLLRAASLRPSATAAGDEDFVVVNGWILKASEVGKAAR